MVFLGLAVQLPDATGLWELSFSVDMEMATSEASTVSMQQCATAVKVSLISLWLAGYVSMVILAYWQQQLILDVFQYVAPFE